VKKKIKFLLKTHKKLMDIREKEIIVLTLRKREIQNEINALSCIRIEPLNPYFLFT
jgi:hypothetical protein